MTMTVNRQKSIEEMHKANPQEFNPIINGRMLRPPIRHVYIYSVAKREFRVKHLLFPGLTLAGCLNGERYVQCAKVADPIPQVIVREDTGGRMLADEDAWRACIDLLNPNNPTMDPYWNNPGAIDAFFSTSANCDLISHGVFISLENPPTEQEIRKAEEVRDKRFRALTQEAAKRAAKSVNALNEFLDENPDVHTAMDALGLEASWHQKNEVKQTCPNCGEGVRPGLAFHASLALGGQLCILDPLKAFKAGAISKERYKELSADF